MSVSMAFSSVLSFLLSTHSIYCAVPLLLSIHRHVTWYGLSVSNTDFGLFWADTAVSRCDTGLRQITEKQFMNMCSDIKAVLSSTQLAFSPKFPKNGRFRLPWSTIDLVNQRRRPNPTVAREVGPRPKVPMLVLCCWLSIFITQCRNFLQTASRYESCERFRDTSMRKWRIRIDTDFQWKNTDFPHKIVTCLHSPR